MHGSIRASAIREACMTVLTPSPQTAVAGDEPWRRRTPLGAIGLLIVVIFALAGGFADWIAPFDPEENDFNSMMMAPSLIHLLGTDQFGRDIFSRLVFGAR